MMTTEGRKRYEDYIQVYGSEPVIKDVLDAAYFGLISEEEAIERIVQTEKNMKRVSTIIGWTFMIFFLLGLLITLMCAVISHSMANMCTFYAIACMIGIVYCNHLIRKP